MEENTKILSMTQKQLEELLTKILTDIKDAKNTSGSVDLSDYLKKSEIHELTSEEITTIYERLKTEVNTDNIENA